ncbi:MAG: MptD family putative ECF transporter S component [Methanobrevibacter arboriphilus]|uniref:MptD family putative ECF transporter S component n=1 Tax=Methanobrevibacter arboriphilus TaxID=39441 RepID=A0A843AN96_METAZ|nr:MptD family putative ECF transporter S component [Methanobrevibacter arboriphilus]MBF4468769.1 MptD family putative ECF transporter S component [Methanobrevibacter arboriphilus]
MNENLDVRDLINVGIFTAIYIIVVFIIGMIGYIPIFLVLLPILVPIVGGIPFMLFITKVKKFGMVTIMALLVGLIMFISGHTWIPILTFLIFGILADLIMKSGDYQSSIKSVIGYAIFSVGIMGNMLPLWVLRDSFLSYLSSGMGTEYANVIASVTPTWAFFVLIIGAFIAGILGAIIGKKVLKKHFKRANIA